MRLKLPAPLAASLWKYAEQQAPRECVGALGGDWQEEIEQVASAHTFYPLPNIAAQPEREYLADPGSFVRALRSMEREKYTLVALFHSHPRGPALPSLTDIRLASYPVPYLIADLSEKTLRAYLLPSAQAVEIEVV